MNVKLPCPRSPAPVLACALIINVAPAPPMRAPCHRRAPCRKPSGINRSSVPLCTAHADALNSSFSLVSTVADGGGEDCARDCCASLRSWGSPSRARALTLVFFCCWFASHSTRPIRWGKERTGWLSTFPDFGMCCTPEVKDSGGSEIASPSLTLSWTAAS